MDIIAEDAAALAERIARLAPAKRDNLSKFVRLLDESEGFGEAWDSFIAASGDIDALTLSEMNNFIDTWEVMACGMPTTKKAV